MNPLEIANAGARGYAASLGHVALQHMAGLSLFGQAPAVRPNHPHPHPHFPEES
ncbi:hypothetical protein ACDW_09100 [Acidovorax sp. DW039]|uniref:hypothetical protein n=1 Tax=Acidovorax sp. DW039 TaxID=3095606 RepID=UPI00308A354B|nr:hypothetical protein ACDW_09100 [Acidovorax sp. DW039]